MLAALGLSLACHTAGGQVSSQDFTLQPCTYGRYGARGDCGRLSVFENRAAAQGRRIDIHFTVVRADRRGARQALFMFAGEPGEGGTALAPQNSHWNGQPRES